MGMGLVMVINDTVCIPVTRPSSIIHLLFPLTKESVSTNNHRGGNYGSCGGIIAIVDSDGTIIQVINEVEAAMGAESDDDY